MGSSESKVAVSSTPKPDPSQRIRHDRVSQLVDPRSPSVEINRTPIQVGGAVSRPSIVLERECPILASDPRSPSVNFTRTPMKDTVRATVGSFARRLGMLLSGDYVEIVSPAPSQKFPNLDVEEEQTVVVEGELCSSQPLLFPQPTQVSSELTPSSPQGSDTPLTQSPFLLLGEAQVEVEHEVTVEDAEEAKESPLHKRLSMSLITCHDAPYQILTEVHQDSPQSPLPNENDVTELRRDEPDHSYALRLDPAQPLTPMAEPSCPAVPELTEVPAATEMPLVEEPQCVEVEAEPKPSLQEPAVQDLPVVPASAVLSQAQPQITGIRCPTFDTKSPSQVVFKPQWLGKGFGVTGVRAKGRGGKGGSSSSPLAIHVGTKTVGNENKVQSVKSKQRVAGKSDSRSPLQILKERNSPREQATQMKLKVSTPDRQRLGQMDRRVLTASLDKEN
ncbi:hypothetical protein UPYG_G00145820 [Umbra pygmaea]|uniref:Cell division cycle-associated protein 3 n=1 Tax=Umbra pygmaea TaxID=75934 RepID=A0ABD0XGW8_UMBPY